MLSCMSVALTVRAGMPIYLTDGIYDLSEVRQVFITPLEKGLIQPSFRLTGVRKARRVHDTDAHGSATDTCEQRQP